MPAVSNLKIQLQGGTSNTYYATWDFDEGSKITTATSLVAGSLVTIKAGATYYNGVAIPSWVSSQQWYLTEVRGDRAVLGRNKSGTNNIMSPINVANLVGGVGGGSNYLQTLDHYEVKWHYDTGNGVWFLGTSTTTTHEEKYSTYSAPENALKIRATVKPVAKTYESNNQQVPYWTGTDTYATYMYEMDEPSVPPVPTATIDKYQLTCSIENISDARIEDIEYEIYNGDTLFKTARTKVYLTRSFYIVTLKAGGKYRVRARSINWYGLTPIYSKWSNFGSEISTIPDAPTLIYVKSDSKTSVEAFWSYCDTATKYTVQYTSKERYFDQSAQVSSITIEKTTGFITGLEQGKEWFFRVCATNDKGDSGWSNIISVVVGTKPEPPTTWSISTTAIVGEDITLYWTHNSEDGSKQRAAKIELSVNGIPDVITVNNENVDDEDGDKENVHYYTFNTKNYTDGAVLKYRICTKGILDEYSDWSIQRAINLYAPPSLSCELSLNDDDQLTNLPLSIYAEPGPLNQKPVTYHVSVIAINNYVTENEIGLETIVSSGSELYSNLLNATKRNLSIDLGPGNIALQNGKSYKLSIVVSMDSGLTAEYSKEFSVNWTVRNYEPDASVFIDDETLTAYIMPFCKDSDDDLMRDVTLAVYRREFNGGFTLISNNIPNSGVVTISDPHPSLDYARYRIVATDTNTGVISFVDLPGQPINEPSIVIQWAEKWMNFDYVSDAQMEEPIWAGSIVKLPFNVDVDASTSPDVSLVKYIGRSHPVAYYGTQKNETMNLTAVIPKSYTDTIYALRRLSNWSGNVYIREPSGIGYWANLTVKMPIKHVDLTVTVTFTVKRVEGDDI